MADQRELNPEEMSLDQLKAAALAEEAKEDIKEPEKPPADMELRADEKDDAPEQYVVRSEIDLGDGSGVQVFTGAGATELEALRDQNTKLVEAQRNATKKIHDLNSKVKAEDTRTDQQKADQKYLIAEMFKKDPEAAMKEVARRERAEEKVAEARERQVQQQFVDSHPDYVADPDNARRITSEVQRLGFTEFTESSLEKAYQSLKASGLLKIKAEEAGGTTEDQAKEAQRIAETKVEATQPRSPKRSSTVSMRGASPTVIKTGLTEDELYALPLDQLKKISNEQLAKAGGE